MGRPKAPLLSPSPLPNKPESPRPRKKLQKGAARHRNSVPSKPNGVLAHESPPAATNPPLPLAPDLSDSKWSEYLGDGQRLRVLELSPNQSIESLPTPVNIFPERRNGVERSSIDVSTVSVPPSPHSGTRCRAKTPVSSIGQLEAASEARTASVTDGSSGVDSSAEQWEASLTTAPLSWHEHDRSRPEIRIPAGSRDSGMCPGLPRSTAELPSGSPTSDDGTLVSFEEETVFFKPVSLSPEPHSPIRSREQSLTGPGEAPQDSLGLRICVDLLTRDLISAMADRSQMSTAEPSALQVRVMIEAYARLRDRILDPRLSSDKARSLEMMMDTWLRALYVIHDSLTIDRRTADGDYKGLGMESEGLD